MRLVFLLAVLLFAGAGYGALKEITAFPLVEMVLLSESGYCRFFDKMAIEDQDLLAKVRWLRHIGKNHDNNHNFFRS